MFKKYNLLYKVFNEEMTCKVFLREFCMNKRKDNSMCKIRFELNVKRSQPFSECVIVRSCVKTYYTPLCCWMRSPFQPLLTNNISNPDLRFWDKAYHTPLCCWMRSPLQLFTNNISKPFNTYDGKNSYTS